MRLFIAEKPSLGRAIADVLPKPHQRGDGFIKCGNDDVVTWCVGHLLEQAEPLPLNSRGKGFLNVLYNVLRLRHVIFLLLVQQLNLVDFHPAFHSPP